MNINAERANGALFAALAKAQENARTVKKEGRNTQARYLYATADDMIAAGRKAREGTGLSLLTTWTVEPSDTPGEYGNQWVCGRVAIHWVLCHTEGGWLSGTAYVDAIGSRGRPPDKAIAAALTYGEGFVERGLMRFDRDENPEDVDQREELERREARQERPRQAEQSSTPRVRAELPKTLRDCTTAAHVEAWCKGHGPKVVAAGKGNEAVGHAVALGIEGVTTELVREWLGLPVDEEAA